MQKPTKQPQYHRKHSSALQPLCLEPGLCSTHFIAAAMQLIQASLWLFKGHHAQSFHGRLALPPLVYKLVFANLRTVWLAGKCLSRLILPAGYASRLKWSGARVLYVSSSTCLPGASNATRYGMWSLGILGPGQDPEQHFLLALPTCNAMTLLHVPDLHGFMVLY